MGTVFFTDYRFLYEISAGQLDFIPPPLSFASFSAAATDSFRYLSRLSMLKINSSICTRRTCVIERAKV